MRLSVSCIGVFFIVFIFPVVAMSTCTDKTTESTCNAEGPGNCVWNNNTCGDKCVTQNNTCASWNGCFYDSFEGCKACDVTSYNNTTTGTNACVTCAAQGQYGTWNWVASYTSSQLFVPNSIFDRQNAKRGQTSCPWICDTDYYKSVNSCIHCPQHSTSSQGSTDITDCKCDAGYYMGGQNMNTCQTCPQHSSNCKQNGSTGLTYLTVDCDPGYTEDRDLSNKRVDCIECTRNSSLVNGTCTCNAGYYGDASGTNGSCTKCPDGTKTDNNNSNARSITDCYMDNTTMFCDGSGYCNTLIRSGYKIKYINTTQQ